jgi:nitroreductase
MAELMEIIKGRRSVRRYQERQIAETELNTILEAIRWAPSWANTQCWEVIVVRDPAVKEKLQETLSPGNAATGAIVEAPVVISLCAKLERSGYKSGKATTKFGDWFMFDLGLATQNLCLAAHNLNMGTVIVGLFDQDKVKEFLGVPGGYEVVALIPVGYPAREAKQSHRRQISEFVHYNTF